MSDNPLTDDYVAEILKRDAERKNQNRFVASGLGSLLSRPRGNAPKPNTRFLKNIVRDADAHNAALRRREEEESKVRLRDLKRDSEKSKKRQRSRSPSERRSNDKGGHDGRTKHRTSERDKFLMRNRHRERWRSRSPGRSSNSRRGNRSPRHSDERESYGRRETEDRGGRHSSDDDTDSLDSVLGPKPPPKVKARGRGVYKDSSMDARFHPSYDPKADVGLDPDEEDDDWDMALEALRDRQKWRKSGADRLRAAGFTEEEVSHFEKGGGRSGGDSAEKDTSDVRWSKKGEAREWDRGKVDDGDRVDVQANWGRLKDT